MTHLAAAILGGAFGWLLWRLTVGPLPLPYDDNPTDEED